MDVVEQLWKLKQIYTHSTKWDEEWKALRHLIPSTVTEDDLKALEQAGHGPHTFVRPDHDETIAELKELAGKWTLAEAAAAFVSSLWSAPVIWRSLLGGKLMADVMPDHEYTPYPSSGTCQICGLSPKNGVDISLEWYWRMTSGTPLDGNPFGYVLALRELSAARVVPAPTEYDRWTFRALLTTLRSLPPRTRPGNAALALKKEKLLPTGSLYAYRELLETLALMGILDTEAYPGMATAFTSYLKRDERPGIRVEIQAPLAWWDSSIGVNSRNLARLFGDYDCSDVSLTDRPEPRPDKKETVTGALENRKAPRAKAPKASPDAGKGEVQAGDVYAVRVREGLWITVYCHEIKDKRAKVEYLDGVFPDMPAKDDLIMTFRPRPDGRWQSWAIAMDSTSWVRRVTREVPCPAAALPEPGRVPFDNAKNLRFMAEWCFPEISSE
jgi:hypothetical protein